MLPCPQKGFVLPNHKYTGPYNPLHTQLDSHDNPLPGEEPFNAVDDISRKHDICYRDNKDDKKNCDKQMIIALGHLSPKNLRERIDKNFVKTLISAKYRLGVGIPWNEELANELHKPLRKKFKKRTVFVRKANDTWNADLVDVQALSEFNDGYKYILMVIDVFSKFGMAVPLKTKSAEEVTPAFASLLKNHKPNRLWTDKGSEFYNEKMKKLLADNGIKLYSTQNAEKGSIIERWNRTIKTRMWKYFSANNTSRYIDILPTLIHKYNTSTHRSIKCTPTVAQKSSSHDQVFRNLYGKTILKLPIPKFTVGDIVRIFKKKKTFEKGYTTNFTEELFTIKKVNKTNPPTYSIVDLLDDPVKGSFYEPELQKAHQETFRINQELETRTRNGHEETLVSWKGYDDRHNSWVKSIKLIDLTKNLPAEKVTKQKDSVKKVTKQKNSVKQVTKKKTAEKVIGGKQKKTAKKQKKTKEIR